MPFFLLRPACLPPRGLLLWTGERGQNTRAPPFPPPCVRGRQRHLPGRVAEPSRMRNTELGTQSTLSTARELGASKRHSCGPAGLGAGSRNKYVTRNPCGQAHPQTESTHARPGEGGADAPHAARPGGTPTKHLRVLTSGDRKQCHLCSESCEPDPRSAYDPHTSRLTSTVSSHVG